MITAISIVYVIVCLFLILVVLLQSGKGGGMGALGGMSSGSNTVFGGAGAGNFLTRLTAICAALFMVLSVALAYFSSSGEQSLDRAADNANQEPEVVERPEPSAGDEEEEQEPEEPEPPADDEPPIDEPALDAPALDEPASEDTATPAPAPAAAAPAPRRAPAPAPADEAAPSGISAPEVGDDTPTE